MRVLILGCGYVGSRLGAELIRQGHEVVGARRSIETHSELLGAGIQPFSADITKREDLNRLPIPFDWIVNLVSSSKGGVDEYRSTYLEGTRMLLEWMELATPKKFVYTSSTGVYGQSDGTAVKETSPTEPDSETGQILVKTERLLLEATQQTKFPGVILRVAGIYGPGRGYYFKQFLKNETRIAGKGERILNMIHVDDLVGILITALQNGRPGEIYNVADEEPVAEIHFYRWLSETLGKWMPPFTEEGMPHSPKHRSNNKKVQNRKLKMELGYLFKYPTFRQGYTAEIQRLERSGELNIEPDPR